MLNPYRRSRACDRLLLFGRELDDVEISDIQLGMIVEHSEDDWRCAALAVLIIEEFAGAPIVKDAVVSILGFLRDIVERLA